MDLSVLPNNNHPDKFLQLEVKSLEKSPTCLQASWAKFPDAALPGVQRWHNRVYLQREKRTVTELPGLDLNRVSQEMIDKALGKHITPVTLKSTIKRNPLYSDIQVDDDWEEKKKNPSWTVQDYDRRSLHSNLASHIKENPNDLQFWMGDIYTPGAFSVPTLPSHNISSDSSYCNIQTQISGFMSWNMTCAMIQFIPQQPGGTENPELYEAVREYPKEAMRMVKGLEGKMYEKWLRSLGVFSWRRLRGDLTAVTSSL
ncbi:hypothetical protein BTVI_112215 [Pitangus sulphuratus]|nr:hypothetical protein BTVI_112215 [Pitangus sulphuratus]